MSEVKTNKLTAATGTAITLGDSGDTFTVPSGATLTVASGGTITNSGTATGFAGDNTPSFAAILSADQSIATNTWTKVTLNTEWWDTNSAFDINTNVGRFTVPSGEDGKYVFHYGTFIGNIDPGESVIICLAKNDSSTSGLVGHGMVREYPGATNDHIYTTGSVILDLDATDFIEFWVYHTEGSAHNAQANYTFMSGFKLVGV
jgi:hypothetical protein